jgi:hypothetical protein
LVAVFLNGSNEGVELSRRGVTGERKRCLHIQSKTLDEPWINYLIETGIWFHR